LNALNIGEGCVLSVAMAEYKQDSGVDINANKSITFQPSSGIQLQSVYMSSSNSSSSSSSSNNCNSDNRPLQILLEQLDMSLSPITEYFQIQN
jgi:hypothetical protein